jgi:DNA replication protein DnaC
MLQVKPADPLPPGLRGHSFTNFQVAPYNEEPYRICTAYVERFPELKSGQGLVLTGKSGTGKTHLACAVANALKEKYWVQFAHVPTLLEKMRGGSFDLEPLLNAHLLILDDIGSERESPWTTERLLIIVEGRLVHCRPTIYTSNYETADFDKRLGMRLASRILGHNVALVLHGPDYRLQRYGY